MSAYRELGSPDLQTLVREIARRLTGPERLYVLGATSHLVMGWRTTVDRFDLAGEPEADPVRLRDVVHSAADRLGMPVAWEHPGDVIPLPDGHPGRTRRASLGESSETGGLAVHHFDPYSVVFRVIARGDEPDYRTALGYLAGGWVTMEELEALLERTLSRFTRETIQQDPAEFRRKFRGLRQQWRAMAGAGTR